MHNRRGRSIERPFCFCANQSTANEGDNMTTEAKPIAIYYEHPDWFRPLFAELERRGTPYLAIDAAHHQYDPDNTESEYSLLFNRMSPSAYLRGHAQGIFHTLHHPEPLARRGHRPIHYPGAVT